VASRYLIDKNKQLNISNKSTNIRSDYFKNFIMERKRAVRYIYQRTLDVRFTVRIEAKLRC